MLVVVYICTNFGLLQKSGFCVKQNTQ